MSGKRIATAIRFDPELHSKLIEYSDTLDVSINWLVNQAVKQYFETVPPIDNVEVRLTNKEG